MDNVKSDCLNSRNPMESRVVESVSFSSRRFKSGILPQRQRVLNNALPAAAAKNVLNIDANLMDYFVH